MTDYISTLLNAYFPNFFGDACALCQTEIAFRKGLCEACEAELPYVREACQRCGLPCRASHTALYCNTCVKEKDPLAYRVFSPFIYQFPVDQLITDLKFKRRLAFSNILSYLIIEKMKVVYKDRPLPDVIIPVPLYSDRLKQRGFNQALEIAKPISRTFSIPLDYYSCSRTRPTKPQAFLSQKDRASNVKNAFAVLKSLRADRVCLVDDVFTTGSTAIGLSKVLFKAGVSSIDIWCCARAVLQPFSH